MAHLRAMAPYPVAPIVRPVNGDPALLKKFLEMGAQTFIVPMIDTPEQAQACADAVYYPPEGHRGVGTALARASRWNQVPDYLHTANAEICLIVQAETVTALENLDAILAVENVRGVFIGPSDLAASLGRIGQGNDPELVARCIEAIKKIKAAGKVAGILTAHEELIQQSAEAGADFIGIGVDTLLLGEALRQRAASRP
jgi:4-hydroxy-2-oxoheptanedioate aldolase